MRLLHQLIRLLLFVRLGKYYSLRELELRSQLHVQHILGAIQHSVIPLRVDETTTFPAIRLRISLTPIVHIPGFLSKGISRHARKASREDASSFPEHSFLVKDAITLQRSGELSPKQFDANILRQPSASSPDGAEPSLVLITALRTFSTVMSSYLIR